MTGGGTQGWRTVCLRYGWNDVSTEEHVTQFLMPGDKFPNLTLKTVDGGEIVLPDDCAGDWAYIMVYRGHW